MTLLTINSKQEKSLMKNQMPSSVCRNCQFYKFQGRNGGYCQQLGIQVRSHWHSCPLAIPAFAPSWKTVRELGGDRL